MKNIGYYIGAGVAFLLVALLMGYNGGYFDSLLLKKPDAKVAYEVAQMLVSEQLTSPGSAKYPETANIDQFDKTFDITGYVDAQNLMGGLLRADYHISLTYNGEGDIHKVDNWTVNKIDMHRHGE